MRQGVHHNSSLSSLHADSPNLSSLLTLNGPGSQLLPMTSQTTTALQGRGAGMTLPHN